MLEYEMANPGQDSDEPDTLRQDSVEDVESKGQVSPTYRHNAYEEQTCQTPGAHV